MSIRMLRVALLIVFFMAVAPVSASADSGQHTAVRLGGDGAWTAHLAGFELSRVRAVTYFVRDAGRRWHRIGPVTSRPFEAPLEWWTWDSAGKVVVTSRVLVRDAGWFGVGDAEVADPGGWQTVDGRQVNPGGSSAVKVNRDGTLAARYEPGQHIDQIESVQFWLRAAGTWSRAGETSTPGPDRSFTVSALAASAGSATLTTTAVSVHVVWQGGRQWVDPVPWVWADQFAPAPTPVPTPTATPTPAPTVAPPTAAPAQAAPAPPQRAPTDPNAALRAQGVSAVCNDGSYSYSQHRSGTCSYHGGVRFWTGLI